MKQRHATRPKSKSFSATNYKGQKVAGSVVAYAGDSTLVLVEEHLPPTPPTLWIIDQLDDVGISLDADEIREIVPILLKWEGEHPRQY